MPLTAPELAQLANETEVIVVRNALNTFHAFEDRATNTELMFAPSGDPDGDDVQEVSAALLRNPNFRKALAREMLIVEQAPEALTVALEAQKQAWQRRQQQSRDAELLAARADDRTVGRGVACIAPGPHGEICGSYALVMGRNPNERPPLCGEHQHLASQYAVVETETIGPDGKPEVVWRRASLIRRRG